MLEAKGKRAGVGVQAREFSVTFIHPTHTCFDDALDMMGEMMKSESPSRSDALRIVHAICLMPNDEKYAHAWLERDGVAWFMGILKGERVQVSCDAKEYREELRVQEFTAYTPWQALNLNYSTISFGPWEEKYLKLCKDKKNG